MKLNDIGTQQTAYIFSVLRKEAVISPGTFKMALLWVFSRAVTAYF